MFDLIICVPDSNFLLCKDECSWVEPVLSNDKYVLLETQHSDTGEAGTHSPLVSSKALYH